MIGDKYVAALVFYTIGGAWLVGWWLMEHPSPKMRQNQVRWKKRQTKQIQGRWLGALAAILMTMLMCLWTINLKNKHELLELHGLLVPAHDSNPPNSCDLSGDELGIYLENNFSVKADRFPLTVIRVAGKPTIVLDRDLAGQIVLSVDVRSTDGKIIARLNRNEFTVNQNNYLFMKRYDPSSLSVTDQDGNEALYARYLNRKAFVLRGRFWSDGRLIDIAKIPNSDMCLKVEHGPEGAAAIGIR